MALTFTLLDGMGDNCPDFQLPGTDGKNYRKQDFLNGKPLLVMFICNHCPYVKAVEDRLIETTKELKTTGINVVAICSNDPDEYPEDNFESLRARALEKKYPFVYLHDANQTVAKAFGAVCTPDFFLYNNDQKLCYRGRLDDSWKDASKVTKRELLAAAQEILKTNAVIQQQTPSMGCNIKWK